MLNACTRAQIERQYALCEDSSTYDDSACAALQRDPTNAACQTCLFSDERDATYGPIVRMRNQGSSVNTAGCMVLIDGDPSDSSCGAKAQAADTCADSACMDACPSFSSYLECRSVALDTGCRPYRYGAICQDRPLYAICTEYPTYREFFLAMGEFWCVTGIPRSRAGDAKQ
jgi:hypothetical protein